VVATLRENKGRMLANPLAEMWRHALHTREFGSHITNVLCCLQLEAHGYQVSVTELIGWEHSMKNELIIARYKDQPRRASAERLKELLQTLGLEELSSPYHPFSGARQNGKPQCHQALLDRSEQAERKVFRSGDRHRLLLCRHHFLGRFQHRHGDDQHAGVLHHRPRDA
jgi:hypothetical protein